VQRHEATIDDGRNRVNIVERSNQVYSDVDQSVGRHDSRGTTTQVANPHNLVYRPASSHSIRV